MYTDKADQTLAPRATDVGDDTVGTNARVGLVKRPGDDVDTLAERLALATVLSQSVQRGQGIGGNVRLQPGNRIAVVIVMSRLNQDQFKVRLLRRGTHRFQFDLAMVAIGEADQ